jgi:hypothetical protein
MLTIELKVSMLPHFFKYVRLDYADVSVGCSNNFSVYETASLVFCIQVMPDIGSIFTERDSLNWFISYVSSESSCLCQNSFDVVKNDPT